MKRTCLRSYVWFGLLALGFASLQGCSFGSVTKNARRARAFYNIGVKQSNKRMYRQALASLKRAEEYDPNSYWIQEALGGTFLRMSRPQLALKHYKKALALQPKSPRGWNNVGTTYMVMKQWKNAIVAYQSALKNVLYQTPCFARINLAWCYHKVNDFKQSDKYFQLATSKCPRFCQGHRLHGLASYERKLYSRAAGAFDQLTKRCKKFLPGFYHLGRTYFAAKRYQEARKPLLHCVEKSDKLPSLQASCRQIVTKLPRVRLSRKVPPANKANNEPSNSFIYIKPVPSTPSKP